MPLIIEWNGTTLSPDSAGVSLGTDGKTNNVGIVNETAGGVERPDPATGLFIEYTVTPPSLDVPLGLKPVEEGYEVQDTILANRADDSGGLFFCYPRRAYVPQDLVWSTKQVAEFNPLIPNPRPISASTNFLPTVESMNFYRPLSSTRRWPFRTDFFGNKSGVQIGVPTIRWPLQESDFAFAVPPIDPDVLFAYTERQRTDYPFLLVRRGGGTFRRYFLPGLVGYHTFPVFGLAGDAHVLIDRQEGAWTWIVKVNRELKGDEDIRWTVVWNQVYGSIQTRSIIGGGPYRPRVLARRRRYNFIVRTLDLGVNSDFQWFTAESGIGVITPEALPTDLHVYCGLDYAAVFFPKQNEPSKFSLGTPIDAMSNLFPHLAAGSDQPLPFGITYDDNNGTDFRIQYEEGATFEQSVPIVHAGILELRCYKGLERTPIGIAYFHCDPAQTSDYLTCWEFKETIWPNGPTN